jgi:hypothetical protein
MADDFERRFRQQHADVFRLGDRPIAWIALAVAYLRFSDENSNPRSLDRQLLNVLNRARRDVPHLRILSNELAEAVKRKLGLGAESFGRKATERRKKAHRVDLYPKVLIRPVCGCCGNPMILGRSVGKYQSFFCFNANNGIRGCTNKGYKSARIIDEAVLGTVMATLFTDGFLADLTADVNKRLAWIARQPIPFTKKLEQEIANGDRQLRRLTDRLAKLDDTHLDAVLAKAEEIRRQLASP